MDLENKVSEFLIGLTPKEKEVAKRAISHFILFQDYKKYRELVSSLSSSDIFYTEVRDWVKSSYLCRKVWRAVSSVVRDANLKMSIIADQLGLNVADIAFVWSSLYPEDREEAKKVLSSGELLHLSSTDFELLVKKLDKYCNRVAYKKLRFISDNDRGFSHDDFRFELLRHSIQIVRLYEHFGDLKKIENYAKRGVNNHAINLIQFYTSESRARVKNVTSGCGTCIFCLTNKPQRCEAVVADYSSTTVSFDVAPSHEMLSDTQPDSRTRTNTFLKFMQEGLSPDIVKVMGIVFGQDSDPKFDSWLSSVHSTTIDALTDNPKRLLRLLCDYLNLSSKDISEKIKQRYNRYRYSA